MIFRKLGDAVKSLQEISDPFSGKAGSDEATLALKKLDLLMQLVSFANSYKYLSHKDIVVRTRVFLQCKYNYREAADLLGGVSLKSLRASVSYAAKRFEKKIGSKTIDLIMEGRLVEAEREFLLSSKTYRPTELFLDDVISRFPPSYGKGVDLGACKREMEFLYALSHRNIDRASASLDPVRVCHLLHVITSSASSFIRERDILTRFIAGDLKVSEAISLLNGEYIYSSPTVS